MRRATFQATLSIKIRFKIIGASQERGVGRPFLKIACIGSQASLIVGQFEVFGQKIGAIIDTGATACFAAGMGPIARKNKIDQEPSSLTAITADDKSIVIVDSIELSIAPLNMSQARTSFKFYLLPNQTNIMGYQLVIGIDLMKTLDINIKAVDNIMTAYIDQRPIGQEMRTDKQNLLITNLETYQQARLDKMVQQYDHIFAESASTLIKTSPMVIPFMSDETIKVRLRTHSPEDIIELKNQIDRLKQNDIIEESESSFSANVHLVAKKNGTKRMVIDYRPLNQIAVKDHYPLPQISDMFLALKNMRYFAALDCTDGFLQISIRKDHRERSAFITPHGQFQFKRAPFGFTNSPAKYQRAMNQVFSDGLYTRCVVYIDDILIFGETITQLLDNLQWVFEQCDRYQVQLKRSKFKFFGESLEFLGFLISHNSISPVPGKYDAVGLEIPRNKKDILAILGAFNHYSRFITSYADKVKPLRDLTKHNMELHWTEEHVKLIRDLKDELKESMPNKIPDCKSSKHVNIYVGRHAFEVSCWEDNASFITRSGSCFGISEVNWTPVEKNLLAITHAYDRFGPFLRRPVTIYTMEKDLLRTMNYKEKPDRVNRLLLKLPPPPDASFIVKLLPGPSPLEMSSQLETPPEEIFYTDGSTCGNGKSSCEASWAVIATINPGLSASGMVNKDKISNQTAELSAVINACRIAKDAKLTDIVIASDSKYVVNAARNWIEAWINNRWLDNKNKPVTNQKLFKILAQYLNELNIKFIHVKGHGTDTNNIKADTMAKETLMKHKGLMYLEIQEPLIDQESDEEIDIIKNNIDNDVRLQEKFVISGDVVYYRDPHLPDYMNRRLLMPRKTRSSILNLAHRDPAFGGHLGNKNTKNKLLGYYWPGMSRDIEKYIRACNVCQKFKTPKLHKYGKLQPIQSSEIFERIHTDIMGPCKPSGNGNRYILTAIDGFSRYGFARALPEVKSSDVIKFITDEIITKHGLPKQIVTDNGSQYVCAQFKSFTDNLGIRHARTCEYHPAANGLDERFNGTLSKIMRNYVASNQLDWDQKLQWAVMLYNFSTHETLGTSLYTTLFGVNPRTPLAQPCTDLTIDSNPSPMTKEAIRDIVRNNIEESQRKQKENYDKSRRDHTFKIFDKVRSKTNRVPPGLSAKFYEKWEGPWMIKRIITFDEKPVAAELINMKDLKVRRAPFEHLVHYEDDESNNSDQYLSIGHRMIEATKCESENERSLQGSWLNDHTMVNNSDSSTSDELIPLDWIKKLVSNRNHVVNAPVYDRDYIDDDRDEDEILQVYKTKQIGPEKQTIAEQTPGLDDLVTDSRSGSRNQMSDSTEPVDELIAEFLKSNKTCDRNQNPGVDMVSTRGANMQHEKAVEHLTSQTSIHGSNSIRSRDKARQAR